MKKRTKTMVEPWRAKNQEFKEELANIYMSLKFEVIDLGYASEIDWQDNSDYEKVTETELLREAGWVILSCGMKETVVRQKFLSISKAFYDWESAEKIVFNKELCYKNALACFGHQQKIQAIITVADDVYNTGFRKVHKSIHTGGVDYISKWPYMGPATSYHLAKNLGFSVAKPDRHLKRIAKTVGYDSTQLMCSDIAEITDDKVSVVDLIFWRFATLKRDYLSYFTNLQLA